jgi:hypothetical protein
MKNRNISALLCLTLFSLSVKAQFNSYITKYPDIPRIDVHTHVGTDYPGIRNYLDLRDLMISDHKIDLAMKINLGGETGIDTINEVSKGRIMTCISDYSPQRGLTHKPEDIAGYLKKGYVGYKIWHGPYYRKLKEGETGIKYIDDPAHEPVFAAMEKCGMVMASVHIADPNGPFGNRGKWCADPVEYWREVMGLERILQRHPGLVVVAAHCAWLICQDAQIDFLRYMLGTYPNFYVDLAGTFEYYYLVNQQNLRDLFVEYSDRFMYGTDMGKLVAAQIPQHINEYSRTMCILETDEVIEKGFWAHNGNIGLNLPREVLEKIYYKNALRIYPGLADKMHQLGYKTK